MTRSEESPAELFELLLQRLNVNTRRHFKRLYDLHGGDSPDDYYGWDKTGRLPWHSIQKCAKRLGLDVYPAVPGDRWDERGGGYWRVVHVSTICAQNLDQAVLIEDCDSPWMHDNWTLYMRSNKPAWRVMNRDVFSPGSIANGESDG